MTFHICATGIALLGGGRWIVMDEQAMPDTPPIVIVEGEAQTARGRTDHLPRRFYSMAWGEGRTVLGLEPGRHFIQTHDETGEFGAIPIFVDIDPGDVNLDGKVNSMDILDLIAWIRAGEPRGDWNANGEVNNDDVMAYVERPEGDEG